MREPGGQEAAAHVYGLLVGGLAFLSVVAVLLFDAAKPASDNAIGNPNRQAGQDLDAGLLTAILSSSGAGWEGGADAVSRLGLGAANGSGLDAARLAALQGASLSASAANDRVDYPDARSGLGLPAFEDFNLTVARASPPLWDPSSLAGLRAAYIGDWVGLGEVSVPPGSASFVRSAAQAQLNQTMAPGTASERQALRETGLGFNDLVYLGGEEPEAEVDLPPPAHDEPLLEYLNVSEVEGDVYPDDKAYISANLVDRLPLYQVLVVGSGIDQSALTPAQTKQGIADWVLAGGRLVALGSDSQNAQWLQPLFSVSEASVTGPVTNTVADEIRLEWPYLLDWAAYDTHGLAWDIKASGTNQHYDDFRHVLVQGGKDVFAVSKDGAFGEGSIALTSYRPREFGDPEATHFLVNLVAPTTPADYDFAYGPAPPAGAAVSAAERSTYVWDPDEGIVQLRVTLRVWDAP